MDLEPIYNPNLNPIYAKPKHFKPKVKPLTLEDIHQKLETLEKKVEYLIQLMEEKN